MKDYKNYISTLALVGALVPSLAMAATSEGEGTAQAKVVAPVTVEDYIPLNFGTVTNQGGTFEVDASGSVYDPDNIHVEDPNNYPASGLVYISGPSGVTVQLVFPSGPVSIYAGGSGTPLDVTVYTPNETLDLDSGGAYAQVGGALTVPSGADEGDYEGTYPITVNY